MRSKKGKQNLEEDSEEENEGLPEPMDEDNGAGKLHIFCEGHKILRNLHLTFACMYSTVVKSKVEIV